MNGLEYVIHSFDHLKKETNWGNIVFTSSGSPSPQPRADGCRWSTGAEVSTLGAWPSWSHKWPRQIRSAAWCKSQETHAGLLALAMLFKSGVRIEKSRSGNLCTAQSKLKNMRCNVRGSGWGWGPSPSVRTTFVKKVRTIHRSLKKQICYSF